MTISLLVLLAYLIGSLSFAVLVSKAFGLPDPRSFGSGNPGATNVLRTGKKLAAALTLLGDAAKGWVAVRLAQGLAPRGGLDAAALALVALAAFVGHLFPVFFRFQGGKGVATALGVLLALSPALGGSVLAVWLLMAALVRISSLSALVAALCAPAAAWFLLDAPALRACVAAISALLILRHHRNIANLLSGREGRIGGKG